MRGRFSRSLTVGTMMSVGFMLDDAQIIIREPRLKTSGQFGNGHSFHSGWGERTREPASEQQSGGSSAASPHQTTPYRPVNSTNRGRTIRYEV
jgi:hypothetical protein